MSQIYKMFAENLAGKSSALTEPTYNEYGERVYTKKDVESVKSALDLHIEKMALANGKVTVEKVPAASKRELLDYLDYLELQKAEQHALDIEEAENQRKADALAEEQRAQLFGAWS